MKSVFVSSILFTLLAGIFSCNSNQPTPVKSTDSLIIAKKEMMEPDSLFATESHNLEDTIKAVPVSDTVTAIRENFKRINSTSNWTKKETRPTEQTTEGGEATYYYLNDKLEKIVSQNYGETFQQLTEYYLLDGKLSFVFEKKLQYNRPLYYDSTAMKENNDTEIFDIKKATTSETRSYFYEGHLFQQVSRDKKESPVINKISKDEEDRIKSSFNELVGLLKKK